MLLGFVFLVAGITLFQEHKTERALEALRDLSSPRALVIRDGRRQRIAGREVVRGDIVILSEGDRVPADAALVSSSHLASDESLLTGESVPVRKVEWDGTSGMPRPGGDALPFVYAGTLVTAGQGVAEVIATGLNTEMGRIGKALQTVAPERSALQRETSRLVRTLAVIAGLLCVIVVVAYGLIRHDWLAASLAGIDARHGHTTKRASCRIGDLSSARSVADLPTTSADAPGSHARGARISHHIVRGQDRDPDVEPNVGSPVMGRRAGHRRSTE